jgi:hypothetical protein
LNGWQVQSKNETYSGQDEQHVDGDVKLPVGKSLEDAQSEPPAEQSGWKNVSVFQSSCVTVEDDGRMR